MTLQSCILDNEASQGEIVHKIDGLLENDMVLSLVCGLDSLLNCSDHSNPEAGNK